MKVDLPVFHTEEALYVEQLWNTQELWESQQSNSSWREHCALSSEHSASTFLQLRAQRSHGWTKMGLRGSPLQEQLRRSWFPVEWNPLCVTRPVRWLFCDSGVLTGDSFKKHLGFIWQWMVMSITVAVMLNHLTPPQKSRGGNPCDMLSLFYALTLSRHEFLIKHARRRSHMEPTIGGPAAPTAPPAGPL